MCDSSCATRGSTRRRHRRPIHRAEAAVARQAWADAWGPSRVGLHIARRGFLPGEDAPWIDEQRDALRDIELRALECVAESSLALGPSELDQRFAPAATSCVSRRIAKAATGCSCGRSRRKATMPRRSLVYEHLRARPRDDLGAAPSATTQDLHRALWVERRRSLLDMCRNIKTLHNFEPPATDDEIRAAALQYVRKVSGSTKPSKANEAVFARAVDEIAHLTHRPARRARHGSAAQGSRRRGGTGSSPGREALRARRRLGGIWRRARPRRLTATSRSSATERTTSSTRPAWMPSRGCSSASAAPTSRSRSSDARQREPPRLRRRSLLGRRRHREVVRPRPCRRPPRDYTSACVSSFSRRYARYGCGSSGPPTTRSISSAGSSLRPSV